MLIVLGKGLYDRRRRAWAWSVGVLALLLANNLFRGTPPQTGVVSLALLAGLVIFRKEFHVKPDQKLDYGQVVAVTSIVFALLYGILGSYLLRAQFKGIESLTDAIYFTFVTYSTVGYGDLLPDTPNAKLFTISMILIGLGSFVTALTLLLGPMIEARLKGVLSIMKRFQGASNHVIVCGYTNVSESVVDELQERDVPYLVIDDREELILLLKNKGHDVCSGDATSKETLEAANLQEARAIICGFDSDSQNILTAVTAAKLREALPGASFRILVRVEDEENIEKALSVGATRSSPPLRLAAVPWAPKPPRAPRAGSVTPTRAYGPTREERSRTRPQCGPSWHDRVACGQSGRRARGHPAAPQGL